MFINFNEIPSNQKIFLDYLYDPQKVISFYDFNFNSKEEYINKFKSIKESRTRQMPDRTKLFSIINNQYGNLNKSELTSKNIDFLKDEKTLAVVTGQQLGIAGGPLYTFYKIMTAIKLSNYLSERYDEYKFVPVFWLEGDDHDFNEVRSINIIDENNELSNIKYDDGIDDEEVRGSVGQIKISDTINTFFDELNNKLRDTEFKGDLLNNLKDFYSSGKTFKNAFRELIFWLFDKHGLIIFDPQDKEFKTLLKPIFKKEINNFRQHTEKLVSVSAQLEESYHAQVKVHPVNLFYSNDEGRFLIEPVENEFRLKRKRKKFSHEEIIEEIEASPENFSPNVLLRPICQDFILPTAFYVAGPSEIAYFAQVTPLYKIFEIESPVIYPRASLSIIEKNINSVLKKYELEIQDFFTEPEELKTRIVESVSKITLDEIFKDSSNKIEIALDQLKEKLFEFDKTISDASTKYKQKIFNDLENLKGKALEAQKKKHEIILRQIDKAINSLYPNSNLQERELNFIYFVHKYGLDIIKQIFNELEINKFKHQAIIL
ncbi:MAG: bacillithiol biosynthesis cysteine-adding enzyme BshC [Ignavibacteriaceae bacterium]|jgi:bacillithiol biosynthesis cysteine-adding enzyme BshC